MKIPPVLLYTFISSHSILFKISHNDGERSGAPAARAADVCEGLHHDLGPPLSAGGRILRLLHCDQRGSEGASSQGIQPPLPVATPVRVFSPNLMVWSDL